MMKSLSHGTAARPSHVEFDRGKYGRELLIDAATVRDMPGFIQDASPHTLAFHDILLVTRGRGKLLLDGELHSIAPGIVVFSLPGQMREWRLTMPVDGACLFFTEEFVTDTFSNPRFLDQFAFFRASRNSGTMRLDANERRTFGRCFSAMQRELLHFHDDATQSLRASLYQTLVLLNRWYSARHGAPTMAAPNAFVERFRRQLERDFCSRHRVADYAAQLGISAGHLNALCQLHAQRSAGALIRLRIALEARKLLLYSDGSAAAVGEKLGFDDPAYFTRFFRREVGSVPTRFRSSHARRCA